MTKKDQIKSPGFCIAAEKRTPLVATAIHAGHEIRDELIDLMAISDADRLREEDPFTDQWTPIADNRILVETSRFEVDLNRPRNTAVYLTPEDAWGLSVWKTPPDKQLIDRSLLFYDRFYAEAEKLFAELSSTFGHFIVLDLHSYCYRREGPNGPPAPPEANPEVNVGTSNLNRQKWAPVVDRFIADLAKRPFMDRTLDVRENVKFKGGNFSKWICEKFPETGCVLAVEFKKFFMDEWTGLPDKQVCDAIYEALLFSVPGLLAEAGAITRLG